MKLGRKPSGGRYKKQRKLRLHERRGQEQLVRLGKEKKKRIRIRGGKIRTILMSTDKANVIMKDKECKVARIKNVLETPANKFLARTNVLIKGAIIDTDAGKARITNRPSREACVNAVLIEG